MVLRSDRPATSLASLVPATAQTHTIKDFLQLLHSRGLERVQLEAKSSYRDSILNDSGSQFTIYDDGGIKRYGRSSAVIKCAKFSLGSQPLLQNEQKRGLLESLHRELLVLTHPSLRNHPNIVQALYYDIVDDAKNFFIPALILERAEYGSLEHLLDEYPSVTILEENKISLCADATAGLLALHKAGIAHGDVKADNLLIFESSNKDKPFIAKLTDFGSTIPLMPSQISTTRYFGTRLVNAPEVDMQSIERRLDARGFITCDNYSLGLLIVQIIAQRLNRNLTAQDHHVLEEALQLVGKAPIAEDSVLAVSIAIKQLLPWKPEERCSDLAFVLSVLRPLKEGNLQANPSDKLAIPVDERTENQIRASIESVFGHPEYLDYEFADGMWTPTYLQTSIFAEIKQDTNSPISAVKGRAYFQLALAHAIGFGTPQDSDLALQSIVDAAACNYLPAQALFEVWHKANNREVAIDLEKQLDWLYDSCVWGSFYASASLRRIDIHEHRLARKQFHAQGGFNQYFHPRDPPSHIGSAEFKQSLSETQWNPNDDVLSTLLQSGVIYGDSSLVGELLERYELDPNQMNQHQETLLILCCKGGHLSVLKALVGAGARKWSEEGDNSEKESPLHWLIAFEDEDIPEAASMLVRAGFKDGAAPGLLWNHPSIDFPGKFPRATPLHFATYQKKSLCVKTLLGLCPTHINDTGPIPEIGTPLDYALSLYRFDIAEILAQYMALDDVEANAKCLIDIGMVSDYEAWAISGVYHLSLDRIVRACIETVSQRAPTLLNKADDYGFTPLMQAAQNHSSNVVKILLEKGCDVNASTTYENDNRTALNLLTENRLDCRDDTFEILVEAGANLSHRTGKGGKMLVHFAARDDNVPILRKALDSGADVNEEATSGETPLHTAAFYGAHGACQLLLEHGANVLAANTTCSYGKYDWKAITPIGVAVVEQDMEMVSTLLKAGGPVARPSSGDTILHIAVSEHEHEVLETLLAKVDIQEACLIDLAASQNRTPLHICVGNTGRHPHVRLLVEAGADIDARTESGYSVLDIAYQTRDCLKEIIADDQGLESFQKQLSLSGNTKLKMRWQNDKGETLQQNIVVNVKTIDELTNEMEGFNDLIRLLEHRGAKRYRLDGSADGLLLPYT